MEIWVYNHLSDERKVVQVGDGEVTIGRDERNTVALKSPFVSRQHARLFKDSGSFFVESLGLNGTTVANRDVPPHTRAKISYGDEIRLGEFSLFMMEPSARRGRASAETTTPRRRLVEFEQSLHAQLLERLNLRVASQVAKADADYAALIKRHLAEIIQAHMAKVDAEMGQHLVREFLFRCVVTEVARRATGKLMYSYGFENTDVLVAKHEEAISRMIGEDIKLIVAAAPGCFPVFLDKSGLHQAIMNLVVNARDAMPRGGELVLRTLGFHLTAAEAAEFPEAVPGDYVLLEVADSGIGMDRQTLESVFEPFFTTKEHGKGTGLGLPMVMGATAVLIVR